MTKKSASLFNKSFIQARNIINTPKSHKSKFKTKFFLFYGKNNKRHAAAE